MRRRTLFLIFLVVSLLLVSCISTQPKYNPDGSPYWTTFTPVSRKYYYGVGSGNLKSKQNSKARAEAMAKDEIARQVSTAVENSIINYISENQYEFDSFENFSTQVANATLRGVEVKEIYTAVDGTVWILSQYDKKNLKEAYKLEAERLESQSEKVNVEEMLRFLEDE
ncbi:MAG: LPP20 family lipoprotein [Sphaerochaetaceae bacterium]|nr:LPP20 family lipoprotein [Sphaerochaetaceae bacterium]